ncbi:hypothetical protein HFO86_25695 [Rhizobium leguminosarum]|nr:hypothetical protein [Rhizobium leguminosarum]
MVAIPFVYSHGMWKEFYPIGRVCLEVVDAERAPISIYDRNFGDWRLVFTDGATHINIRLNVAQLVVYLPLLGGNLPHERKEGNKRCDSSCPSACSGQPFPQANFVCLAEHCSRRLESRNHGQEHRDHDRAGNQSAPPFQ